MTTAANRFWRQTEALLSEFSADVRLHRDGFYSQPDWDVYQMRYTSADIPLWSVPERLGLGGGLLI